MPLIKPIAQRLVNLFGFTLLQSRQVPNALWNGLSTYPMRTILDIGACRGGFAREILHENFPAATIHSFEPSPVAFETLRVVGANSGGAIVAHNFGLGEQAGTMTLCSTVESLPSSSLLPSTAENTTAFPQIRRTEDLSVELKVLDDIASTLKPSIADDLLVKIDVQGFEDRVIRGGKKTIAQARAAIIEVQVAGLYVGQPSFRDLFLLMDEVGFAFIGVLDQYCDSDGRVLYFDAVFLKR
ncbi:MAG: FkbM family methyltransferase [Rhodospirillales bacterium]|nr:FkbM family methyltransferase [Rhodospirillales bacterium]